MNKYYLKINLVNKNNKKRIINYQLCNNDKIIKQFDDNDIKRINKIIKDYKSKYILEIDKSEENYKIYDMWFLKKYIGIPSNKVSHINKNIKKIGILSTLGISFITLSIVDHKVNPDLYNSSKTLENTDNEHEIDFVFIDKNEPTTEETYEDINTPLIYHSEDEKEKNYTINFIDDNTTNIEENIISSEMITSSYNIYTRCFECKDLSQDEKLLFIKNTYKIPIQLSSQKYGIDPNWIAAKIRVENPDSEVKPDGNGYGVGLMQIEGYVWNNEQIEDIDGNIVTIDCNKMNNIAQNHINMDKVANLLEEKNISSFDDIYNLTVTDEELIKYDITLDDIEKYKNATYSIEKGNQIWESYINELLNNNDNNYYNYKLTDEECENIANLAYNKGITCIRNCLNSTYNYEDTITAIVNSNGGVPDYQQRIDQFLDEGYIITNKTRDNRIIQIEISHQELEKEKAL